MRMEGYAYWAKVMKYHKNCVHTQESWHARPTFVKN
jgi:hypothetical protein